MKIYPSPSQSGDSLTLFLSMTRTRKDSVPASYRLLVGGLSSVPLVLIRGYVGSMAVGTSLLYGLFASISVAFLLPLLVLGDWGQRILATALLVVPVVYLIEAFLLAAAYQ